jgi:hypothetical protein
MSEADWWICGDCQSLNNLSARKCYKCRTRKPQDAVRASDYLGYQPVESWDGRVTMRMNEWPDRAPGEVGSQADLPPLRDPVRRDTLAVAPRPPRGARIEYSDPPEVPPPPVSDAWAEIGAPQAPAGSGILGQVAHRPDAVGPANHPGARAMSDPGEAIAEHQAEQRAHWQDLLDVPRPDADRLRAAYAVVDGGPVTAEATRPRDGLALHHAMNGIRHGEVRPFRPVVIWPEADVAQPTQDDAKTQGHGWAISGRGTQPAT